MGYPVIPVGIKEGQIGTLEIKTEQKQFDDIHTISMYLSTENQKPMYDFILSLKPKRIIFNPGSENMELAALAKKSNIEILHACTLVLLSTGQYELSKAAMDGSLH